MVLVGGCRVARQAAAIHLPYVRNVRLWAVLYAQAHQQRYMPWGHAVCASFVRGRGVWSSGGEFALALVMHNGKERRAGAGGLAFGVVRMWEAAGATGV